MKSKRDSHTSSTEKETPNIFKHWQQIQNFTNDLSKKTNQMDELMKAMHYLSFATKDTNLWKEINSSIAKLNQMQTQKNASTEKAKEKPALSGDTLYDLFNSPTMANVVKEVMKNKRRKK